MKLKVLVACEYSGRVRDAFIKLGHDATSCDILKSDTVGPHYQGDIIDILHDGWDLLIAHPPCTFLTLAGVRWLYHPDDTPLQKQNRRRHPNYPNRLKDMEKACVFFNQLKDSGIPKICIENSQPHGVATELIGSYSQKVQPWMFGEPFTKGACLWLKDLKVLVPTHTKPEIIIAECHKEGPSSDRWKKRSTTYQGIANAMAIQWGGVA